MAARVADAVREGPRGSAWFAHRDGAGLLTGIEMRGADYRNFSAGGDKTLFRLPGGPGRLTRVAVCEAAIDALSLAAIERARDDTLYAATAGGMGPATIAALQQLLQSPVGRPGRPPDRRDRRRYRRPALRRPPGGPGDGSRGAVRRDLAAGRAERLERRPARDDTGAITPDRVPVLHRPLPCSSTDFMREEPERKSEQRK